MVLAEALSIGLVSALYGALFGYLLSLLIALGVSQLATLAPARRAARVNIIEALKHE